jgi:hypothetical protein
MQTECCSATHHIVGFAAMAFCLMGTSSNVSHAADVTFGFRIWPKERSGPEVAQRAFGGVAICKLPPENDGSEMWSSTLLAIGKAPRGFEPRSLDSESRVLAATPRGPLSLLGGGGVPVPSAPAHGERPVPNPTGLLWELNPGPLAPEARIMLLDQAAK